MSVKSELGYPGTISTALRDGQYPGVRAVWFWTVAGFNRWFTEEPGKPGHGLLVTDVQVRPYFFGLLVGVAVQYTKQLSMDEQADFLETSREIEFAMQAKRIAREAARLEARQVEEAAKAEVQRLAAVGRKYEDRVKHMRSLAPSDLQRKELDATTQAGDPELLFTSKLEAFQAGFVHGHTKAGGK